MKYSIRTHAFAEYHPSLPFINPRLTQRTLNCINHVFASKEDVKDPPVNSASINRKPMPPRFDRMLIKNTINTAEGNSVSNSNLKSSFNSDETVPMSNRRLNTSFKSFDVSMVSCY